ncbi:hypothetical protein B0H21DRAFT_699019, partial [Amylocystis lapponica]
CAVILDRVLEPKASIATLVPLIPELRKLATKYQKPVTSPYFAHAFRKIMSEWVTKVLGPMPADPSGRIASIKKWTCDCGTCSSVRKFLTERAERSQSWLCIGAPTRKHVEGFLEKYARGAATWATVGRSPQGITASCQMRSLRFCGLTSHAQVTKANSLLRPVQWLVNRKAGNDILESVSRDPTELHTIFGTEYDTIVGTLTAGLKSRTNNTVAGGSSGPAMPPRPAPGFSATARLDTEPPRKRVKTAYNENDVIDLT